MSKVTLAEALEAVKRADPESVAREICILRAEMQDLALQILQKEKYVELLQKLCPAGRAEKVGNSPPTALPPPTVPPVEDPWDGWTPPSQRWRMIYELLRERGPMRCADVAVALGFSYDLTHMDLRKRQGHYFNQLPDKTWTTTDVEMPREPDSEAA